MTVAQLIDILKTLPQELPVRIADWSEQYVGPGLLTDVKPTNDCVILDSDT
jgi:hypothetical protein